MAKHIILTNKDDYQTELNHEGLEILDTYQYFFFDKLKAKYTIAIVHNENIKITLTENKWGTSYINHIPIKFFEAYETIEDALDELKELSGPNSNSSKLELMIG